MRLRSVVLALLAAVAIVASPGGIAAQGSAGITVQTLGSGSTVDLYRFRFDPSASIPGPYPEPIMLSVVSGTMLLYLGSGARATLDPRGSGSDQVATLDPIAKQGGKVTFEDTAPNRAQPFTCQPTCQLRGMNNGLQVGGNAAGDVGVILTAGYVVFLPGPSSAFVCNTGDDDGRVEVTAVKRAQPFSWLAYATAGSADAAPLAPVRALPALNPGGCAGRTG